MQTVKINKTELRLNTSENTGHILCLLSLLFFLQVQVSGNFFILSACHTCFSEHTKTRSFWRRTVKYLLVLYGKLLKSSKFLEALKYKACCFVNKLPKEHFLYVVCNGGASIEGARVLPPPASHGEEEDRNHIK